MTLLGRRDDNSGSFQKQAVIRHQVISHMPVFVCYFWCLSACGRPSIVYEPVDSGHCQEALGVLAYSGLPYVTESNGIHMQI